MWFGEIGRGVVGSGEVPMQFMNLIIPDFQSHSLEGKLKSDEVW